MKTNSVSNQVYVLESGRIPFAKSRTAYKDISRKELMVASLNALVDRFQLEGRSIGDTALGALMNSSSDFNLARESILSTKFDPSSPAYNVQRACGTSLETAWQIALKVHTGAIDVGIAGGVDTNRDLPLEFSKDLKPKTPVVDEPRTGLSMSAHCELMVKEWGVTQAEQDDLAFSSHQNASKAYEAGFFGDLVTPYLGLTRDGTLRPDTSLERLAKLKPAVDPENSFLIQPLCSSSITEPSTLLQVDPPQHSCIGTLALWWLPLELLPLHQDAGSRSSI